MLIPSYKCPQRVFKWGKNHDDLHKAEISRLNNLYCKVVYDCTE